MKQVDVLWYLMESSNEPLSKMLERLPQIWRKDILLEEEKLNQLTKVYSRTMLQILMDKHQVYNYKINHTFWDKPYIEGSFSFSISHSKNLIVVAAGHIKTLGIDVESYKPISVEELSGCFSPAEQDIICQDISPARKIIHYWCCKEAVLKADGRGLSVPMDKVAISTVMNSATLEEAATYTLRELKLHPDYACWLALPHDEVEVRIQEYDATANE